MKEDEHWQRAPKATAMAARAATPDPAQKARSSACGVLQSWSPIVGLPLPDGAVELLQRLDECQPTIPDQLTRHCLRVTGNDGTDERL